jgi:prepilin-type N-terminal cleavage/methylation domain-containing protein
MKRNPPKNLKKQAGLTLIEILIVLVIAAGLLFGIFYLVGVANERSIIRDEVQSYNTMANDARTSFRKQGDYAGVAGGVLIQLGVVPPTMINGTAIRSGWNTAVVVAPINLNGTANDGMQFTYTVPRTSCPNFIDGVTNSAARISIDGEVVKNVPANLTTVNVAAVASACNAGAGGNVPVLLAVGR